MTASITLITGAGGALGACLAKHLLAKGGSVALIDRPAQLAALEEIALTAPKRCESLGMDVTSAKDWSDALSKISSQIGDPTGAALTVGGWSGGRAFHESSQDVWTQMMDRNLVSTQCSLRAIVPEFVKRKQGSIVIIGAMPAVRPWEGQGMAAYTASKAAVVALAQAVASELIDHHVRVNVVLPSTIDTPANRASMPQADFSRWVTVESLSKVIAFLLSEDAKDITGAALPVYGRA